MKKNYKRTFWASFLALFLGTSCCWISSLAIWIGGAALIGTISNYLPILQMFLIVLGVFLGVVSIYLYQKR